MYSEASSDSEPRQQKKQEPRNAKEGQKKDQRKQKKPQKRKDDSDDEAERVLQNMRLKTQDTSAQYFEAFDSESEGRASEGRSEAEAGGQEGKKRPTRDPELTARQLKDIVKYEKVLEKLEEPRAGISTEGIQFLDNYKRIVNAYLLYVLFNLSIEDESHPVMRKIKEVYLKVKEQDAMAARLLSHAAVASQRLARRQEADGDLDGEEEEEDGFEEGLDDELDDDLEEQELRAPRVKKVTQDTSKGGKHKVATIEAHKHQPTDKPAKKQPAKGLIRKKLQTFKLDFPSTYLDVHRNVNDDDESDDDLLNLGKRQPRDAQVTADSANTGEITLADLNLMSQTDSKQAKKVKASARGIELYNKLAEAKTKHQSDANELKEKEREELDKFERKLMFNERRVKENQPRTVTEEMFLNRGLRRKREKVISKVKIRRKFELAKKKDRVVCCDLGGETSQDEARS